MTLLRRVLLGLFCAVGLVSSGAGAQNVTNIVPTPLQGPQALTFDKSGNLYVLNRGLLEIPVIFASGPSSVVRVAPDGTAAVLVSTNDSLVGLAVDPSGTVYVANVTDGGVDRVEPDGSLSLFVGPAQGLSAPEPLVFDAAGNLYVGNDGNNTISKVTPAGAVSTYVDSAQGMFGPLALAVDASGTLYIGGGLPVTPCCAFGVMKVTTAGTLQIVVVAGSQEPSGLGFDPQGNLYVSYIDDQIDEYSPAGTLLSSFGAGDGPTGLALDAAGNAYFAANQASAAGRPLGSFIGKRSAAGTISTFLADPLTGPLAVAVNPSGGFYVLEGGGAIDRVSAQGAVTPFVSGFATPTAMIIDATGTLYVSDANGISKVSPAGAITAGLSSHTGPLTLDAKGNLYVADTSADLGQIFQITPAGSSQLVGQIPSQTPATPMSLAVDAAGDLYVLGDRSSPEQVTVLTSLWEITPAGTSNWTIAANAIALDAGGRLYYSDFAGIQQLMSDGSSRRIVLSGAAGALADLSFDSAGTLYGVGERANTLVGITLPNPNLAAAVLPGSRSVQVGKPADVLASVINSSNAAMNGCGIALPGGAPAGLSLSYQTTNPATNALTGTANQPVTIIAGATQSFVIGLTDSGPLVDPGQPIVFSCDGASPAQSVAGVNTVDLLFSASPVPDIIALAATSSGNGIVSVPAGLNSGGAAFAVATTNAGIAAPITVSADTGSANLGLRIALCQTDPQTALCLAPPAESVTLSFAAGATPTFSVFLVAPTDIAFDPATARVFLRFKDAAGTLHGSTSVAVEAS